jgi:transcription elongation factor GreA
MLDKVIEKLQAEVAALNHELNVTLPNALEKAVAHGDLRENADYQAALERQGFVGARLSQLRARLVKLSQIDISKIPTDRVGLGSRVIVRDQDTNQNDSYELVVPDLMDIDSGHISVASPLGSALVERQVGDVVTVRLPMGTRVLEIIELRTLHDVTSELMSKKNAANSKDAPET